MRGLTLTRKCIFGQAERQAEKAFSVSLQVRSNKSRALLRMYGALLRKCKCRHAERQGRENIFCLSLSLSKAGSLSFSLSFYRECSHILCRMLAETALSLSFYAEFSHSIQNVQAERALSLSCYRECSDSIENCSHSVENAQAEKAFSLSFCRDVKRKTERQRIHSLQNAHIQSILYLSLSLFT